MGRTFESAPSTAEASRAEALADRFHGRLVIFALRRLGDRALADDAAQETLRRVIEAMQQQDRIRDPGALPAFVFQTAKHVCQQWLRKRGREHRALQRYAVTETAPLASSLDGLVSEERQRAVRKALGLLASDDRNLLQYFYGMGLSAGEVAARLRVSDGTVRVRKHRALKRLSAYLDDDETFAPDREPDGH